MTNGKSRNLSLDLLRIISMMMVVGMHVLSETKAGVDSAVSYSAIGVTAATFVRPFITVGVNCFV